MNTAEMLAKVTERLCNEPLLSDFKYTKSNVVFKLKVSDGCYKIFLWCDRIPSWWLKSKDGSELDEDFLQIHPYAFRHFDILCHWLRDFVHCEKKQVRKINNIMLEPRDFDIDNDFYFCLDGSNFEKEYHRLYMMLEILMEKIFEFPTLESLYERKVKDYPISGIGNHPNGITWIFPELMLSRIIDPDNYSVIKNIMKGYIYELKEINHPAYKLYESKIPAMFERLEQLGDEIRAQRTPMPGIDHDPIWDQIRARLD